MDRHGDRVALASLLAGGVLAGGNAVGVRFTVLELDALWGAGLRFAAAAAVLTGLTAVLRLGLPGGRLFGGALLYGLLNFGGAFAFVYYMLVHIQAGLASTLIALFPLATLLLAVTQRQERLRGAAVAGGVLALGGVAVVSGASLAESVPPLALGAGLASVLCMGQAAIVARRLRHLHPVVLNAVGMAVGAAALLAGAVVAGDRMVLPQQPATWLALGYLVLGGSVGLFMLYLLVLRYWEASRAAYLTLLMPPVAVLLSAWLDSEPVTPWLVAGGALILAGVYVGAVRRTPVAPPTVPPAPAAVAAAGR